MSTKSGKAIHLSIIHSVHLIQKTKKKTFFSKYQERYNHFQMHQLLISLYNINL